MVISDSVYTLEHLIHMLDLRMNEIRAEYNRTGDKVTYNKQAEIAYAEHMLRMKGI